MGLLTIPVAERYKARVCGPSLAGIAGLNPAGAWLFVCCKCCVLSGRGLCDWLITRPEESYRLWRHYVWFRTINNEAALVPVGLLRQSKKKYHWITETLQKEVTVTHSWAVRRFLWGKDEENHERTHRVCFWSDIIKIRCLPNSKHG